MKSPIFLFSMPRSGSTLLQRILMTHPEISSHAEPWVLLPLAYMHDKNEIQSNFGFESFKRALDDVISSFPDKEETYYDLLRQFTNNIYDNIGGDNTIYFLDKTPRYFYIIDFINKLYPDAKFIFLSRDPRDIFSSYVTSFRDNSIRRFDEHDKDLYNGFNLLVNGYKAHSNKSIHVSYEAFVENPENELKIIASYLEVDYNQFNIEQSFKQNDNGYMGDKKIRTTQQINIVKNGWKKILNTNIRKIMSLNILNNIENDYYKLFMQEDKTLIIEETKNHVTRMRFIEYFYFFEMFLARKIKTLATKSIKYKDYY